MAADWSPKLAGSTPAGSSDSFRSRERSQYPLRRIKRCDQHEIYLNRYRPEIDGLRAVAILPVVLFHARIPGFSGGFVGVDVFFVISGFLITSLIVSDLEQQRFSLVGFWERRARRILPALLTVAGFTLVTGWFLLLPADFARLGQSILAQSVFGSNVFFWQQSGYFGPLADELPLLHTWSLAVEEQFYLLFPVSMVVISRFAFRFRGLLVLTFGVASLAISIWAVEQTPGAAFYLLPSRAWELAVGAWLALQKGHLRASDVIRQVVSFLGIGLIAFSVVVIDPATPFPGIWALPPVLGTAAVIWADGARLTFVGRLLAARPLVFVGLISYSLYLWHWPLFVFARYINSTPILSSGWNLAVISFSFALAYMSWRLVETPFRKRTWVPSRRKMLATAGAGLLVIGTAGFSVDRTDGIPGRLPDSVLTYLVEDTQRTPNQQACDFNSADAESVELCRFGNTSLDPAVVSWGDSHAEALLPMFEGIAEADDVLVLHASNAACPPLFGVEAAGLSGCADFNERMFQELQKLSPSISLSPLGGRSMLRARKRMELMLSLPLGGCAMRRLLAPLPKKPEASSSGTCPKR